MKRKTVRINILVVLCVLTLLTGCNNEAATGEISGESQTESTSKVTQTEDRTYTLLEIHKNYQLTELLKQNDYIGYSEELYREDNDEAASKTVVQFHNTEDGIQLDLKLVTVGDSTLYKQGRISKDYPGAAYVIYGDGSKSMTAYPEGGYEAELERNWIFGSEAEKETLVDCENQDGVIIVSTRTDYLETNQYYSETLYYINPENDQLINLETSIYNEDGNISQLHKVTLVYNKPFTMEKEPYKEIISDADYCEVNVVYEYMTDNPNVQWFPVSDGTSVSVSAQKADGAVYKLYSDADLTIEYKTDTATAGKTMNIFAVK